METLELITTSSATITDTLGVTAALRAIKDIEDEVAAIEEDARLHAEWFAQRIASKRKQIDFHVGRLESYAQATGQKSITLPMGRIGFRTTQKDEWPDDEVLRFFCTRNGIPLRTKEEVDKRALKTFIDETGTYPEGYKRVPTTTFHVKTQGEE